MEQTSSTVLMVRPAAFGFNYETAANNTFQDRIKWLSRQEISEIALSEFDQFVATLRYKDIDVIVVQDEAEPPKPDAIFPNNWFCTLPNRTISIFPMWGTNRQIEVRPDVIQQLAAQNNYYVQDYRGEAGQVLEGTGSMVIDHQGKTIYACLSPRTELPLLEKFASENGYDVLSFDSVDENGVPIYHTNVMMHIGDGYAIVCTESIANEEDRKKVINSLSVNHEIVDISYDQVHHYAGNMLQLRSRDGSPYLVMSRSAYESLSSDQIERLEKHTQLLPVLIPVIEKVGGGSARCMLAEIF